MLNNEGRIASGEIMRSLKSNVMQNERTDNAFDGANDQLMQILCSQSFRYAQQPLNVLAVRRITSIFCLRSVIVHTSSERFQRQHTHSIRSH